MLKMLSSFFLRTALAWCILAPAYAAKGVDFIFNQTNVFNYSYPNSNWTYVPCENGFHGENTCDTLTGTMRTACVPHEGRRLCTCMVLIGMHTENCTLGSFSPRCISGMSACFEKSGLAYFGLVCALFEMLLCAICFVLAVDAFRKNLRRKCTFNAKVSSLTFVIIASVALFMYDLSSGVMGVLGQSKSIIVARALFNISVTSAGIAIGGVLAATFNICAVWIKVVEAIVKLRAGAATNLNRREFFFVAILGSILSMAVVATLVKNMTQLAGALLLLTAAGLCAYTYVAGQRFDGVFRNMNALTAMRNVTKKAAWRVFVLYLSTTIGMGIFAVYPRYPSSYVSVAALHCAYMSMTCVLLSITQYLRFEKPVRASKVVPKNHTAIESSAVDETQTVKTSIETTAVLNDENATA